MFYGYHRVSTKEQNLDRGIDGIKLFCEKHNYPLQKIFVDKNIDGVYQSVFFVV